MLLTQASNSQTSEAQVGAVTKELRKNLPIGMLVRHRDEVQLG